VGEYNSQKRIIVTGCDLNLAALETRLIGIDVIEVFKILKVKCGLVECGK